MSRRNAELSGLQLAVMQVLWARRQATVAEVHEALFPSRGLALTTIATTLKRLETRGILDHETRGRIYVYRPLVEESEVQRSMVGALMDRLFQGDPARLVSHLLAEGDIDPRELDRLRRGIEEASE